MVAFVDATGVAGGAPPRRYLWTDAFAVCNFLGLHAATGEGGWRNLALGLVEQVHHTLGRHREEDARRGWISGLPEHEGDRHPTRGGLRIGKRLPERGPGEPYDPQCEWSRDGQYFHYLARWMHALHQVARATGEGHYLRWAVELAATAHQAFTFGSPGLRRMAWKMSIDLTRPLVPATGQHDPLDALVAYVELQAAAAGGEGATGAEEIPDLSEAIADADALCRDGRWDTEDPLGIGGLLFDAGRLAHLVLERGLPRRELLRDLLAAATQSLLTYARYFAPAESAGNRLAFRELGLSIGLHAAEQARLLASGDRGLAADLDALLAHRGVGEAIERFWSDPDHRHTRTWTDHGDINNVMLASSLAPRGYLAP